MGGMIPVLEVKADGNYHRHHRSQQRGLQQCRMGIKCNAASCEGLCMGWRVKWLLSGAVGAAGCAKNTYIQCISIISK